MGYMFVYNKKETKNIRRVLRKAQTPEEIKLWKILKGKQILGLRFLRQYGVENYILDFYCPELKLAIEADGGQHNQKENKLHDDIRTNTINSCGITILRFWNNEINTNLEGVFQKITGAIKGLKKINPNPL